MAALANINAIKINVCPGRCRLPPLLRCKRPHPLMKSTASWRAGPTGFTIPKPACNCHDLLPTPPPHASASPTPPLRENAFGLERWKKPANRTRIWPTRMGVGDEERRAPVRETFQLNLHDPPRCACCLILFSFEVYTGEHTDFNLGWRSCRRWIAV